MAKRVVRSVRLAITPTSLLRPIDQFRKAGHNRLIYNSKAVANVATVVVMGGYLGDSIAAWRRKSPNAEIHAYEPVPEFFSRLERRFSGHGIHLYDFGLALRKETRSFVLLEDGTSGDDWRTKILGVQANPQTVDVSFETLSEGAKSWPDFVDVMEINIEGGEYELIDALADTRLLGRVGAVFVQFHDVGPNTSSLVQASREKLEVTHQALWGFEMVWECWILKDASRRRLE